MCTPGRHSVAARSIRISGVSAPNASNATPNRPCSILPPSFSTSAGEMKSACAPVSTITRTSTRSSLPLCALRMYPRSSNSRVSLSILRIADSRRIT